MEEIFHLFLPAAGDLLNDLPGKLGVRIEDVIVITEQGCQDITLAPKELLIL